MLQILGTFYKYINKAAYNLKNYLLHLYEHSIKYNFMIKKITKTNIVFCLILLLQFFPSQISAFIYEGFDMDSKYNVKIGKDSTTKGISSEGWLSTWQLGNGNALYIKENIDFNGFKSEGGASKVIGERKENHIGKGFIIRQTANAYIDTVYGSFRVKPGHMSKDTVFGLLFTLPGVAETNIKNSLFAICPKRFGSKLGVVAVGKKAYKMSVGSPCIKGQEYLVVWKMTNLPVAGDSNGVSVSAWVLNKKQAEFFGASGMHNKDLNLAETGSAENQVCQFGRMNVKETKHSLYKGILVVPFNYNATNVVFDEIRFSKTSLSDASGLLD
tara:strand:- start:447 stop:1430 length:984 start_codon:yes stop_codon:yes gene_type:complete